MPEADTMAIPFPVAQTRGRKPLATVLKKAKSIVERTILMIRSREGADAEVREWTRLVPKMHDKMFTWLNEKFPGEFKSNPLESLKFFVARGNYEFAEKFYEPHPEMMGDFAKEDEIEWLGTYPVKGKYAREYAFFGINLEKIKTDVGKKGKEAIEASVLATILHESLHHIGDFRSDYAGHSLKWLYEGLTERTARKMLSEMFPNLADKLQDDTYIRLIGIVNEFEKLIGGDVLHSAYFAKDFEVINIKLLEEGLHREEIFRLLEALGECDGRTKEGDKEFRSALEKINEAKELIKRRKRRKKGYEELDDESGISPAAIEAIKETLPETQQDQASRLALDACILHKIRDGVEPTAQQVLDTVVDAYEANNRILAYTINALLSEATSDLPEIGFVESEAFKERAGEEMRTIRFGERIDYETMMLVEASYIEHMLKNGGDLPVATDIQDGIVSSFRRCMDEEGVVPSIPMVTSQITRDTHDFLRATSLKIDDSWVIWSAKEDLRIVDAGNPEDHIFNQPYSEDTKSQLIEILDSVDEFSGYGMALADKSSAFFHDIGAVPTCGEIFGLAVTAFQVLMDPHIAKEIEAFDLHLPGSNTIAEETLSVINDFQNAAKEANMPLVFTGLEQSTTSIKTFWKKRETPPENINRLTGTVQAFSTLLKMQHPADTIRFDPDSCIRIIAPDGTEKVAGEPSLSHSLEMVGSTDISDPRERSRLEFPKGVLRRMRSSPNYLVETAPEKSKTEYGGIFELPPEAKRVAVAINTEYGDPLLGLAAIFQILKSEGEYGIQGSMFIEDREHGSKTVKEVLKTKQANCLELTMAYLEMAEIAVSDRRDVRVMALEVVNTEQRVEIGHACIGILIKDKRVKGHPAFNLNPKFRKEMLSALSAIDSPDLKLLVIDPVNGIFDYHFDKVKCLDKTKLASMFHSNSGCYSRERGIHDEQKHFRLAKQLWDSNPVSARYLAMQCLESDPATSYTLLHTIEPEYRNSQFYYHLAQVYERMGKHSQCLEALDEALRLNSTDPLTLQFKARMHLYVGESPENYSVSEQSLLRAIKSLGKRRNYNAKLAFLSYQMDKGTDIAATDVSLSKDDELAASLYFDLALTYFCSGNLDDAIAACDRGLCMQPGNHDLMALKTVSHVIPLINHRKMGMALPVQFTHEKNTLMVSMTGIITQQLDKAAAPQNVNEAEALHKVQHICKTIIAEDPACAAPHILLAMHAALSGDAGRLKTHMSTFEKKLLELRGISSEKIAKFHRIKRLSGRVQASDVKDLQEFFDFRCLDNLEEINGMMEQDKLPLLTFTDLYILSSPSINDALFQHIDTHWASACQMASTERSLRRKGSRQIPLSINDVGTSDLKSKLKGQRGSGILSPLKKGFLKRKQKAGAFSKVVDSDLTDLEKGILIRLITCSSTLERGALVAIDYFVRKYSQSGVPAHIRMITTADKIVDLAKSEMGAQDFNRREGDLTKLISSGLLSLDGETLRIWTDLARQNKLSADEVENLAESVLRASGHIITEEKLQTILPHVCRLSSMMISPIGKLGKIDVVNKVSC